MLRLCAFLPLLLTGCATSNEAPSVPSLPDVSERAAELVSCATASVVALPGARGTGWTNEQAAGIVGDLRASELAKARCAASWMKFYSDLRGSLGGKVNGAQR